jgi:hypothetical protein
VYWHIFDSESDLKLGEHRPSVPARYAQRAAKSGKVWFDRGGAAFATSRQKEK